MERLGDKIAELLDPAPKLKDMDEDFGIEACVDKYKTDYGAVEAMGRSKIRIKNFQPCLNKRYVGKKISRKKLMNDSEDSDHDILSEYVEDEDDDEVKEHSKEENSICSMESEHSSDLDEDDELNSDENRDTVSTVKKYNSTEKNVGSENSETYDDDEEISDLDEENEDSMIEKFSSIDMDEELKKGKAVKAQLSLWDRILENRIKLQKLLLISNKLPQCDNYGQFFARGNDEVRELVNKGHRSIKLLLDLLVELQTELLWRNSSTNYIISNKDKSPKGSSDEEIPSDTEDDDGELKERQKEVRHGQKRKLSAEEYPEFLSKRHKSFIPFRNGTIQKWNDKVKISSGKFTQNSFSAFDQSALKQIEQILTDKPRLIRKTQVRRSAYRILGKSEEAVGLSDDGKGHHEKEYDAEIFDDDDFYHQLLRELIEKKIDVNDPVALSRQWLEIQKLRKKMKKNVDTKASKGRKVRYDVMPKLVNFMASIGCSNAAEETVNELCRSLFKDSHQAGVYT